MLRYSRHLAWMCVFSMLSSCGGGAPPSGHYTYRERTPEPVVAEPVVAEPVAADTDLEDPVLDTAPYGIDPNVVAGLNDFGLNALRASQRSTDFAITLSPASIALALGMTYEGARGETRDEIRSTLRLPADDNAIRETVAGLLQRLDDNRVANSTEPREFGLFVANRLFVEQSVTVHSDFAHQMADIYRAPSERVDFAGAANASRVRINDWVATNTRDRIRDLIPEGGVDSSTRVVLTNAIYFNAAWLSVFNLIDTRNEPFHRANGTSIEMPMMHQTSRRMFADTTEHSSVALPYADPRFEMLVVLPKTRNEAAFRAWLQRQSSSSIATLRASLRQADVAVTLPKWRTETSSIALGSTLRSLGMSRVFSSSSDLSGIADGRLQLSEVFHKVFVDVAEAGTEAAAATAAVIRLTSAIVGYNASVVFRADRPFVYFLRDVESGLILFVGVYNGPSA